MFNTYIFMEWIFHTGTSISYFIRGSLLWEHISKLLILISWSFFLPSLFVFYTGTCITRTRSSYLELKRVTYEPIINFIISWFPSKHYKQQDHKGGGRYMTGRPGIVFSSLFSRCVFRHFSWNVACWRWCWGVDRR